MTGHLRIGPFIITTKSTLRPVREAVGVALAVGEIHFETCLLSAHAKLKLLDAQSTLTTLFGHKPRTTP